MAQPTGGNLNEFCASGVRAKQTSRLERERREMLLDAGVESEEALFATDDGEVTDVHFVDPSWLSDDFMRELSDARGNVATALGAPRSTWSTWSAWHRAG